MSESRTESPLGISYLKIDMYYEIFKVDHYYTTLLHYYTTLLHYYITTQHYSTTTSESRTEFPGGTSYSKTPVDTRVGRFLLPL